jgi:hypothetical protein
VQQGLDFFCVAFDCRQTTIQPTFTIAGGFGSLSVPFLGLAPRVVQMIVGQESASVYFLP